MPLHPEAQRFLELTASSPQLHTRTLWENRAATESTIQLTGNPAPLAKMDDIELGAVLVRIHYPVFPVEASPVFVAQVILYPVMNLSNFETSPHREPAEEHYLTRRRLEFFYAAYNGDHDRIDPRMSPGLCSDLSGFSPMLMITAEYDPFRDRCDSYV